VLNFCRWGTYTLGNTFRGGVVKYFGCCLGGVVGTWGLPLLFVLVRVVNYNRGGAGDCCW